MDRRFIGALDGGGTKTAAVIAWADGSIGRQPVRGGCNPQDNPDWAEALDAALGPLRGADHVVMGLPGFGEAPAIDRRIAAEAAALLGGPHVVMNDVALACRAAFPDGGGVLILSGTGSMGMASGPAGVHRAGGWGDLFGDEGSGFWIGREALARASRERDGRAPDRGLADGLERRLGLEADRDGRFALLGWALDQRHPRSAVASVAAQVDGLAEEGLEPAREILIEAAEWLAMQGRVAAKAAGLPEGWRWAGAGSVLRSGHVARALAERLGPAAQPAASTLAGGLILAAEAAGWETGPEWRARVIDGCR